MRKTHLAEKSYASGLILIALLTLTLLPVSAQDDTLIPAMPFSISLEDAMYVTTIAQANLRLTPDTDSTIVEALPQNARLTILERAIDGANISINGYTSAQWLRVRTVSDREGYIWSGLVSYEITNPALPNIVILAQSGVVENELAAVAAGAWIATEHQETTLGSLLPATTIHVLYSQRPPTGDDSAAVANDRDGNGPFLSVLNQAWLSMSDMERALTTSHELMHRWQIANGCLSYTMQPLGHWITEGWAEWSAMQAAVLADWFTWENAMSQLTMFFGADVVREPHLSEWVNPANHPQFEANYGYNWAALAIGKLVEDHGINVLTDLCSEAVRVRGSYENFPRIFEDVTQQTPSQFDADFLTYITTLGFVVSNGNEEAAFVIPDARPNGCIPPINVNLSRILISCHGVNPDANPAQAGFVIQPGNRFDEITDIQLPEGAEGRWEERTEVYFVRFPHGYTPNQVYTVVFVYNGTDYPFQFVFPP